jgi:hypothetical protein
MYLRNRRAVILITAFMIVLGLVLLGWLVFVPPPGPWPDTSFFAGYNQETVTKVLRQELQRDYDRVIAGIPSFLGELDSGRGKTRRYGPQRGFKEIDTIFNTKPENIEGLMRALRIELVTLAQGDGAQVFNNSNDSDKLGFNFEYTKGSCKGAVKAKFEKRIDSYYKLSVRIDETQGSSFSPW